VLAVGEVRDRAVVLLDGEPVGVLSRTAHEHVLPLPARAGELTVLVEDQGRVNYGPRIGEPKGLVGPVRTAVRELTAWTTSALLVDPLPAAATDRLAPVPADQPVAGPALLAGAFDAEPGVDHFWSTDGWGKGLVWVNGTLLGRYWSAMPTRTLYVPGPLVRERNEVVVLELGGAVDAVVRCVAEPVLGPVDV
jgi:beta-galactosidase